MASGEADTGPAPEKQKPPRGIRVSSSSPWDSQIKFALLRGQARTALNFVSSLRGEVHEVSLPQSSSPALGSFNWDALRQPQAPDYAETWVTTAAFSGFKPQFGEKHENIRLDRKKNLGKSGGEHLPGQPRAADAGDGGASPSLRRATNANCKT